MIKHIVLVLALGSILMGCGENNYPQLSGVFLRVGEPQYSSDSFKGKFQWPKRLRITDRLENVGSKFTHNLRFDSLPYPDKAGQLPEAKGSFLTSLAQISRIDNGVYPNDFFDGFPVAFEKGSEKGPWCYANYYYMLFADPKKMIPSAETLEGIYQTHKSINGQLEVSLSDNELRNPPQDSSAAEKWLTALSENNGITIVFELKRYVDADITGCDSEQQLYIDKGEESVTVTYHAALDSYDVYDAGNPASFDAAKFTAGTTLPSLFFGQVYTP